LVHADIPPVTHWPSSIPGGRPIPPGQRPRDAAESMAWAARLAACGKCEAEQLEKLCGGPLLQQTRALRRAFRFESQRPVACAPELGRGARQVTDEPFLVLRGDERKPPPAAHPPVIDAEPVERGGRRTQGIMRREHYDNGIERHFAVERTE